MDLFFRKFGQGPPLIILHGLYGSSGNWISIGKILAENFEVFLPDLRNHGNSPSSKEYSYIHLKNDLFGFMKSQNIEKAVIMGHSMGGKAAMFFAKDFPEMIQALVIVDISPRSYIAIDKPDPQSIDHKNIVTSLLSLDLTTLQRREDADKILMQTIKSSRIRQFLLKNLYRKRDGSFIWKINLESIRDNLHLIMDGMNKEDFIDGNGITGFPVLFIRGEKSNYVPDEDIPLIKIIFPMSEIVTIPGSGHWLHAEQPDLLAKMIVYFVLGKQ